MKYTEAVVAFEVLVIVDWLFAHDAELVAAAQGSVEAGVMPLSFVRVGENFPNISATFWALLPFGGFSEMFPQTARTINPPAFRAPETTPW